MQDCERKGGTYTLAQFIIHDKGELAVTGRTRPTILKSGFSRHHKIQLVRNLICCSQAAISRESTCVVEADWRVTESGDSSIKGANIHYTDHYASCRSTESLHSRHMIHYLRRSSSLRSSSFTASLLSRYTVRYWSV